MAKMILSLLKKYFTAKDGHMSPPLDSILGARKCSLMHNPKEVRGKYQTGTHLFNIR